MGRPREWEDYHYGSSDRPREYDPNRKRAIHRHGKQSTLEQKLALLMFEHMKPEGGVDVERTNERRII